MTKKILFLLISLFLCVSVYAEDFYIENYDVDIKVNKLKQAHITENIDVYFYRAKHGIFRDIPHANGIIEGINVSELYQFTENKNTTNIKIGYPDRLVKGKHKYTISYNYNYLDNKNEFYHNIIGTGWDTDIKHVKFNILMPEVVNPSDVGLSIGKSGVKGFNGGAVLNVNGRNISGEVSKILKPNEGVTIYVSLPKGYFDKTNNTRTCVFLVLISILTFISLAIWYKIGKDEMAIPVVNFYPPEKMNLLETEIAYKENASTQGLVAMLISLAQKGYIKIYDDADDDFILEKLKSYDGNDDLEKTYMQSIFSPALLNDTKVSKSDLETSNYFYINCENIIKEANSNKNVIYEKESVDWNLNRVTMLFCLLGVIVILFLALFNFDLILLGQNIVHLLFITIAIFALIFVNEKKGFVIIWSLGFGGIPLIDIISRYPGMYSYNVPIVYGGLIGTIICFICFYHLKKRNKNALRLLGKLLGFKQFIETAEKRRLQMLVEKDPQYFYSVLPYAYIFGISDKWIKQFEGIMKLKPDWYSGGHFGTSFRRFSNAMQSVSVPSVANGGISSGSSSGGGGCSGGGGGGGGGGSW